MAGLFGKVGKAAEEALRYKSEEQSALDKLRAQAGIGKGLQGIPRAGLPASKLGDALIGGTPEALARAKAMGFDAPVLHGTTADIADGTLRPGRLSWLGPGVSVAPKSNAWLANEFADGEGGRVLPLRYRGKLTDPDTFLDTYNMYLKGGLSNKDAQFAAAAELRKQGFTGAHDYTGQEMRIWPDEHGQMSDLRSVHAAFDPAKSDSSDLLAGVGGALTIGGLGGLAAAQPDDAQAAGFKWLFGKKPPIMLPETPKAFEPIVKPPLTANQQLYARPHGARAQRILEKQAAADRASTAALRSQNKLTTDAFDMGADDPLAGTQLARDHAQRFRENGNEVLFGDGGNSDFGNSATDALAQYRRADWNDLVGDRLTHPDFNPPRNRYNALPWAIGAGAGGAAYAGSQDQADASPLTSAFKDSRFASLSRAFGGPKEAYIDPAAMDFLHPQQPPMSRLQAAGTRGGRIQPTEADAVAAGFTAPAIAGGVGGALAAGMPTYVDSQRPKWEQYRKEQDALKRMEDLNRGVQQRLGDTAAYMTEPYAPAAPNKLQQLAGALRGVGEKGYGAARGMVENTIGADPATGLGVLFDSIGAAPLLPSDTYDIDPRTATPAPGQPGRYRRPSMPATTQLAPADEPQYRAWLDRIGMTKAKGYAMDDNYTGTDYDMRGFYKKYGPVDVNVRGGQHFTDEFKLPDHQTFSNQSIYAKGAYAPYAGSWNGDTFVPPKVRYQPQ